METGAMTRVPTWDEVVCIPYSLNTIGNIMTPIILHPQTRNK